MLDIDGIKRTDAERKEHAAIISAVLGSTGGKYLMDYLRMITTHRVMPNTSTSDALWHLEGQRHITMILNHWQEEHGRRSTGGVPSNGRNASTRPKRSPAKRRSTAKSAS